ncbi:MAG TPA: phosphorylase [Pseudolabrys sp.]|nr:phosphorylase [Pseudolabrys sp.]
MIVVVGLAFEARIAATSGRQIICAGTGHHLEPALRQAAAIGCRGLISFGVAGGLRPDLTAGTCIVASAVVAGQSRIATDLRWSRKLLEAMPKAISGVLAGAPAPVASADEKRALHAATAADAVDTESHIVARIAADHGLPMAAVRVVCDPAARSLPPLVIRSIRANGTTDIGALLRSIVREPKHLRTIFRVALDARAARATLVRSARLLGPETEAAGAGTLTDGTPEPVPTSLSPAG